MSIGGGGYWGYWVGETRRGEVRGRRVKEGKVKVCKEGEREKGLLIG